MRILAIDTATDEASVALSCDGGVSERHLASRDFHSSTVLGAVDDVLAEAAVAPHRLDAVAVTVGPGSFTGLRVGIATAQGIALGTGCPVVPMGTLDALALLPGLEALETVVIVVNAFRGEVFFAHAVPEPTKSAPYPSVGPTRLLPLDEFLAQLERGTCLVGNVAQTQREEIHRRRPDVAVWDGELFVAAPMTGWAELRLAAGAGIAPEALRVDYGRGAHIGKPRPAAPRL